MADTDDSREAKRAWQRAWRAANPDKVRAYRAANRVYMRAYYAAQPEKAGGWARSNPEKMAFVTQKAGAKRRGVAFLLTFEEWWDIWQNSGKWEQRGYHKGQYVMARFGDVGPYAVGNVRICLCQENNREAATGKRLLPEHRAKISEGLKAYHHKRGL